MLQKAEDDYYLTSEYLLKLLNKAYDLFLSSEIEEKRQILKLILQNSVLDGKLVKYDVLKPYDTILKCNDSQVWLRIPRINRSDSLNSIIKAFQNPIWTEQARERLKQIHTLTRVAAI